MKTLSRIRVPKGPKKIKIEIPIELQLLADLTGKTPVEIIQDYVNNLTSRPGNHGANERFAAKDFFSYTMDQERELGHEVLEYLNIANDVCYTPDRIEREAKVYLRLFDRLPIVKEAIKEIKGGNNGI